jgi:cytochrome c oxidase cbb3-type subunit 3
MSMKSIKQLTNNFWLVLGLAVAAPLASQAQDDAVAKGEQVFQAICSVCHKMGEQVIGPDLTGIHDRRSPEWIKGFIKNSAKMIAAGDKDAVEVFEKFNKTQMLAFESTLAEADLDAVVAYLKGAKAPVAVVTPPTPITDPVTETTAAPAPAKGWFAAMSDGEKMIFASVLGLVALIGGILLTVVFQLMGYIRDLGGKAAEAAGAVEAKPQIFRLGSRGLVADIRGLFSGVVTDEYIEGHTYDGIQELDNGMPSWLAYFFYVTIVFGAVYWLNYHTFKFSELSDDEYKTEMAQAAMMYGDTKDKVRVAIVPVTAKEQIEKGKASFMANCAACHGKLGEGTVGPNLTDEYWKHGGKFEDIFKVVREGVPAKGMIAWKGKLSDQDILEVSTYIQGLKGTNPPNAKAPEGDKAP